MPLSRRDLLRLGLGAASLAALPRPSSATAPPRRKRPRYFLQIFLSGGIDAIYTTDPKTRADVEPWVDVPYEPREIVDAGAYPLGPLFAPLAPFASRMAIVNGVRVGTANHFTGAQQWKRMKTGAQLQMPTLLELIGTRRSGQPIGCLRNDDFAMLRDADPSSLQQLSRVLRAQAKDLRVAGAEQGYRTTAANVEEAAALMSALARVPPFRPVVWSEEPRQQRIAVALQQAMWAFEHDLTSCVYLNAATNGAQPWDSHNANVLRQTRITEDFLHGFTRMMAMLDQRENKHGKLAANTLVLVGSELGRFPRINGDLGKDHFPEAPYVLLGPAVRTGAVYGSTGKKMESGAVSTRTGKDVAQGGHALTLDDLGATLLHLAGFDQPSVYGYDGKVLEFLVAA